MNGRNASPQPSPHGRGLGWTQLSALVVGFGSIGKRHARVLKEIGLADVRVCDPMPERQASARDEFGATRVFESLEAGLASGPDTVVLCSPTALHVHQAAASISAGCDVLTEKPLSNSMDGIDELRALARQRQRLVMVAHCFRFHEGLLRAKSMLDAGRIGRVLSVRCMFGEYIPEVMPDYRDRYIFHYSGAYELMHDIDLALWFAGRNPVRVFGVDGTFGDSGMQSPDLAEMIIEFEDRCVANVHLDFFQRARHRQTEVYGTEGTIRVEFARWDRCTVSVYDAATREWTHDELATDRDDMFRAEDEAFLVAAANRSPVPVDIDAGELAVRVMLAAQESSRTGRAVPLR